MTARAQTINARTRSVLETVAIEGRDVRLTCGQLTPADYAGVKAVLEALGGVWTRSVDALVFPPRSDPAALVAAVLKSGTVPLHARGAEGFVRTPADLAEHIVSAYAELWPVRGRRLRVLEPSSGDGRIVDAILAHGRDTVHVTAVESNAERAGWLDPSDAVTVHATTFEAYAATAEAAGDMFDAVVMNPPFSVPGNPTIWADHVRLAWGLLAPGGRLVAIVPASVLASSLKKVIALRGLIERNGGTVDLGPDEFEESGVTIPTAVVWMDRPPIAAPAVPLVESPAAPHLFRSYTGAETPITVTRPYLTRDVALSMPVQAWRDGWRNATRVLRYLAACVACSAPLWGFDDGENDPRGALGEATSAASLSPEDYDAAGTSVGLCWPCSDGGKYRAALATAEALWAAEPAPSAPVTPAQVPAPAPAPVTAASPVQLSLWAELVGA